jgi:uncharacterized membrane protein
VPNAGIATAAIWRYTFDQIAGALLLGAPEIYRWHIGDLANNVQNIPYTNFVLAFRIGLLVVVLAILATLGRSVRLGGAARAKAATPGEKAH